MRALILLGLCGVLLGGEPSGFVCANRLDEAMLREFTRRGVTPAPPCDDATFLRRACIDALGTLPTADEARAFLADRRADKRARLVEALLARDEFVDYAALRWGDLLRIKAEFPSNLWPNAVQAYHRWLRDRLRANTPLDALARELLTATGSNFRDPPANFWRAFPQRTPRALGEAVAVTWMGTRLGANGWSEATTAAFCACFARVGYKSTDEWKEEIVLCLDAAPEGTPAPATPDGRPLAVTAGADPRAAFADWLLAPGNPWFARAQANRIWAWIFGRGLVHEADDLRDGKAPWSAEALDLIAGELAGHGFDARHLWRLILNSRTYQAASLPVPPAFGDDPFARWHPRRLPAEVLLDALNQVTGGREEYSSAIPEPFTYLPWDQRAIRLEDASIESPVLTLFGRPARNTSLLSERSDAVSVGQAQHLLNASQLERKITRSRLIGTARLAKLGPAKTVDEIYLTLLARPATDVERGLCTAHLAGADAAKAWADILWALINTSEFIFQH